MNRRLLIALSLVVSAGLPVLGASVILEIATDTLTTYKPSGSTAVQGVRPLHQQRGVNLDGSLRAPSAQGWHLAGNPLGDAWDRNLFLGDLRLDLGAYAPTEVDLSLPAQVPWIIGRSYNAQQETSTPAHQDSNGYQGKNWFQLSQPEIVFCDDETNTEDAVYIVYGGDRYLEFQRTGESSIEYKAKNGAAGIVQYVSGSPDTWVYYDQRGTKTYFFGGNTSSNRANWQIWKIVDPAGNTAYAGDATTASTAVTSGYNTDATIATAYDSADRRFSYAYTTLDSVKRLTQVKAETRTGGTWASPTGLATVGQVDYAYYQSGGTTHGDAGNLKTVTQTVPMSDSGVNQTQKKMYWYWVGTFNASTNPGHPNTIQYEVDYEGYRAADLAGGSGFNDDPLTMSESTLKPYAKAYFTYDSSFRIKTAFFDGDCGCGSGLNGTYSFTYGTNSGFSGTSGYDTAWKARTVVDRPDGAWITQYFDEVGQPLGRLLSDTTPDADTIANEWPTEVTRDSSGLLTEVGTPANALAYDHDDATPFDKSSTAGKVAPLTRESTGDLAGLPEHEKYKKGTGGTAYLQSTTELTSASLTVGGSSVVRPLVAYTWVYTEETATAGAHGSTGPAGAYETQRAYTMWTSAAALMPKQVTTTYPTVASGNNGSGSATSDDRYLRKDGTVAFTKNAEGIVTSMQYTNGLLTKRIEDADTDTGTSYPSNEHPNTDFGIASSTAGAHLVTTYTYDAQGRPDTVTMPDGTRVTKMYYSVLADRRMVTLAFPKFTSGTPTYYGPVTYTITNQAGKVEFQGTVALSGGSSTTAIASWIDEAGSDPITALDVGTLASMKTNLYNSPGTRVTEARAYFLVPASGAGTEGTNYDSTRYGYDDTGRLRRVENAAGTITRTKHDAIGRPIETYIGTNDNDSGTFPNPDPDRDSSGTANMTKTEALEYDGNDDHGNSNLTKRTLDPDGLWVNDGSGGNPDDRRITTYAYDLRDRMALQTNPQKPHVLNKYDGAHRPVASGLYSGTGSITVGTTDPAASGTQTDRIGLSETFYDEKGQVHKTTRHKVDLSDGSKDDSIDTLRWYDPTGRLIKVMGDGEHEKYRYDRLGRRTHHWALATNDDTQYGHATASTAVYDSNDFQTVIAGDIVLVEIQTTYESTTGLVLMRATISRFHDDLSNGNTGALDTNADADASTYTASNVKGRPQFTVSYYDDLYRLTDTARYGTYAAATFSRPGSVASRSDTVLVTTNAYNTDGTLQSVTDPKSHATRYEYDALFRQTKVINNYDDGTPGGGTHADKDQTIVYAYSKGLRASITADLPSGTDQVTTYIYGGTKSTPTQMKIATGHLLRAVKYPDSGNGGTDFDDIDTSSSDVASYAYNALGEQVYTKDQAGNVVETDLDSGGRPTQKRVTTLISGFDGAVRRIATTYTDRGQVLKVTQYDNATVGSGSVTDDLKYAYDDWWNVTSFTQDVDSNLDAAASGRASFQVTYTYTKASPSGGAVHLRKTGMSSPGGSDLTYEYLSTSNSLDDAAGRVSDLKLGAVIVTSYKYNGVADVVGTTYDEPNFYWRQYTSTSGDYADRDRFDRIIKCKWTKGNATPRQFYDTDIAYDRDSGITSVVDNIHTSGAAGSGNGLFDVQYTNDDLERLIRAEEGNWTGSAINNPTRDQRWMDGSNNSSLTQVGNIGRDRVNLNGDADFTDAGEIDDTRTHDVVNQLTGRDTDTSGTDNYTLAYDLVGNQTDDGKDYTAVYDAFGRLVTVKTRGGSPATVAEYRYNGLSFRMAWHYDVDTDGTVEATLTHDPWYYFCHDERWRIVATFRYAGSGTESEAAKERSVFHNAGVGGGGGSSYIDGMVLRQKDADTAWSAAADGTLEERLYYCQNWRQDVSLIVTAASVIVEWVKYSAYGIPHGLAAADTDSGGTVNVNDLIQIQNWTAGGTWDARGDVDSSGTVNATDGSIAPAGESLGRGILSRSDVNNRTGYAGYQYDPVLNGDKWHVRYRVLDSELCRFTRRDPLGYVDGMGLYGYVQDQPISHNDAMGLVHAQCSGASTLTGSCGCSGDPCTFLVTAYFQNFHLGACSTSGGCPRNVCRWVEDMYRTNGDLQRTICAVVGIELTHLQGCYPGWPDCWCKPTPYGKMFSARFNYAPEPGCAYPVPGFPNCRVCVTMNYTCRVEYVLGTCQSRQSTSEN